MNIVAFGASTSKKSINKQFAHYVAQTFEGHTLDLLDLNDYALPLFSVDLEAESGFPEAIHRFIAKLDSADLLIISMTEHNGNYSAAFKNLLDWTSRVKLKMFDNKKIVLLSASPGGRGGKGSLDIAAERFPRHGAQILATFSLPFFEKNFQPGIGITDEALRKSLQSVLDPLRNQSA